MATPEVLPSDADKHAEAIIASLKVIKNKADKRENVTEADMAELRRKIEEKKDLTGATKELLQQLKQGVDSVRIYLMASAENQKVLEAFEGDLNAAIIASETRGDIGDVMSGKKKEENGPSFTEDPIGAMQHMFGGIMEAFSPSNIQAQGMKGITASLRAISSAWSGIQDALAATFGPLIDGSKEIPMLGGMIAGLGGFIGGDRLKIVQEFAKNQIDATAEQIAAIRKAIPSLKSLLPGTNLTIEQVTGFLVDAFIPLTAKGFTVAAAISQAAEIVKAKISGAPKQTPGTPATTTSGTEAKQEVVATADGDLLKNEVMVAGKYSVKIEVPNTLVVGSGGAKKKWAPVGIDAFEKADVTAGKVNLVVRLNDMAVGYLNTIKRKDDPAVEKVQKTENSVADFQSEIAKLADGTKQAKLTIAGQEVTFNQVA